MNLGALLDEISILSYDIEYEENLRFARELLGMRGEEAKTFAREAADEQMELDREAARSRKKKEILKRMAEKRKALEASRSEKRKIQKIEDKLEELFDSLQIM